MVSEVHAHTDGRWGAGQIGKCQSPSDSGRPAETCSRQRWWPVILSSVESVVCFVVCCCMRARSLSVALCAASDTAACHSPPQSCLCRVCSGQGMVCGHWDFFRHSHPRIRSMPQSLSLASAACVQRKTWCVATDTSSRSNTRALACHIVLASGEQHCCLVLSQPLSDDASSAGAAARVYQ
jgi:hypothetical protein